MWSVAPLSIIQELKEEIKLLFVWLEGLEGIIETWLEALPLDLVYCKRANNVWYCSGVKPICWDSTSDFEPSWFCSLLLKLVFWKTTLVWLWSWFWFLNLKWGGKPCFL